MTGRNRLGFLPNSNIPSTVAAVRPVEVVAKSRFDNSVRHSSASSPAGAKTRTAPALPASDLRARREPRGLIGWEDVGVASIGVTLPSHSLTRARPPLMAWAFRPCVLEIEFSPCGPSLPTLRPIAQGEVSMAGSGRLTVVTSMSASRLCIGGDAHGHELFESVAVNRWLSGGVLCARWAIAAVTMSPPQVSYRR